MRCWGGGLCEGGGSARARTGAIFQLWEPREQAKLVLCTSSRKLGDDAKANADVEGVVDFEEDRRIVEADHERWRMMPMLWRLK